MRFANRYLYLLHLLAIIILLPACSNTKKLPQNESLYLGSTIRIVDKAATKKERKFLRSELNAAVRPLPNKKIFGMRVKLRLYNFAGVPSKPKGFKNWLRNKVGEPPVLTSSVSIPTNEKLLQNILQNRGYFFNTVTGTLDIKRKKSRVYFDIATTYQYKIRKTDFPEDSSLIAKDIQETASKTLLKSGAPYNLDLIKGERVRIESDLKEKGYYYFKPDYLYIEADTTVGNHLVDMKMRIKRDSVPDLAYNIYRINDVYVYTNYQLNRNADTNQSGAIVYDGLHIVDRRKKYRPFLFRDMLLFQAGDLYNRTEQNKSISRLINLNTFKFVKNRFEPTGNADTLLNAYYYLSAFPKKSLRFEIGANTQNDSRAGSELSVSWRNRNTFRAAEEFMVKLNGGFESQYTGIAKQPSIYTVGGQVGFSFPYFVVPFFKVKSNGVVVPRTIVKAIYSYESQQKLLRINSYKFSFGYNWKESVRKEHQLYPFNINYVRTDTFSTIASTATYANLLFNGLIIGPTYEFTYNSQVNSTSPDNYYFDGLADFSGVVIGAAQQADAKTNPQQILGQNYAQYAKLQTDFRYYHRFPNNNTWASRILIGAGLPYGNSTQLPNIKQFFSGGNSSLRGFRSRLVGPGTFNEKYLKGTTNYIQTLGDLKLELNTELRVDVYKFFKVGFFVDAGNIWLYNDNPIFPGGKFSSQFIRELAADAGLGLRFDFKILLLRFDMAIPIRKPWLPEGERWVFREIDFKTPEWRSDNLIFNLAIGYPF